MIQFDPITYVLVCAGFFLVCAGLKKLAEAHTLLTHRERKESHE